MEFGVLGVSNNEIGILLYQNEAEKMQKKWIKPLKVSFKYISPIFGPNFWKKSWWVGFFVSAAPTSNIMLENRLKTTRWKGRRQKHVRDPSDQCFFTFCKQPNMKKMMWTSQYDIAQEFKFPILVFPQCVWQVPRQLRWTWLSNLRCCLSSSTPSLSHVQARKGKVLNARRRHRLHRCSCREQPHLAQPRNRKPFLKGAARRICGYSWTPPLTPHVTSRGSHVLSILKSGQTWST